MSETRRLSAVILAAGASTRLGRPKQLVDLAGERLLDRTVRIAREAGCEPIVVLGASADEIQAVCDLRDCRIVLNDAWGEGLASSLRAGVLAVQASGVDGLVVLTCDQPTVNAQHLRLLASRAPLEPVASAYAGRRGIPAYFPASSLHALTELAGDRGAQDLLRNAVAVELAGGELDIDTEETLSVVRQHLERHPARG